MHPKVSFFYYLAAIICFIVAALGEAWRFGARSRKGLAPRVGLVPLGLALSVIPVMWTAYKTGF